MSFTPRLDKTNLFNNTLEYYIPLQPVGEGNPFENYDPVYDIYGNCTWFAFGRFWECGTPPTLPHLPTGNAGDWYNANDGYERGQTPRLGAVICFSGGNQSAGYSGLGHVAIVEEIHADGTITVGESGWRGYDWRLNTRDPSESYPYSNSTEQYEFQGFIYNPYVTTTPPEPSSWITGNRYLSRSEQDQNAIKFYYRASALGASYNAILGMLANIESESTINPGIWESLDPYNGGYGLVQWTPYTKYSNWAGSGWENNGDKEVEFLKFTTEHQDDPDYIQWFGNDEAPNYGYPVAPPISLLDFWDSTLDPKTLADYWVLYYEHPREDLIPGRIAGHQAQVEYYDSLLGGGGPIPPTPIKKKLWLLLKAAKNKRMKGMV